MPWSSSTSRPSRCRSTRRCSRRSSPTCARSSTSSSPAGRSRPTPRSRGCRWRAAPRAEIAIDAEIDLSERCEITWAKLPYTIRNLTGRLELHPDRWVFRDVRGRNGQAVITASGVGPQALRAQAAQRRGSAARPRRARGQEAAVQRGAPHGLARRVAEHLADDQSVGAPATSRPPWTSNRTAPDRTHIEIVPLAESTVRLLVMRSPQPKHLDPGGLIELRMDDVRGRFVFDNGVVAMNDVSVQFRARRCGSTTGRSS